MLLKGVLGSATDNKLNIMRPVVRAITNYFPYVELSKELKIEMTFNDMEIENLLNYNYVFITIEQPKLIRNIRV